MDRIAEVLKGLDVKVEPGKWNVVLVESPADILADVAERLKALGFDHVKSVTAIDRSGDGKFEVVYHVSSYSDLELARWIVSLKTYADASDPTVPSLSRIWPSATFLEREQFDLVGVKFEGHPRLERLLLPDDWEGPPPLRKEFKLKTEGVDA